LWTDPSLLAGDLCVNKNSSADVVTASKSLRSAFKISDELNIEDPSETSVDSGMNEQDISRIILIAKNHMGALTERNSNSKSDGMFWDFSEAEIQDLEDLLETKCKWSIEKHGLAEVADWWKHFKAYLPEFEYDNLTGSPKSKKKNLKKDALIPGVDVFWTLDDAVRYICNYGNILPVDVSLFEPNLRMNFAELEEPDYKYILSNDTFNMTEDFLALFKTLLDDKWNFLKMNPTPVKDFYPDISTDQEVDCVLVGSWVEMKEATKDGMLNMSSLVLDKDFFIFKECAINYLKVRINACHCTALHCTPNC
jgi:hypothetical protein